MDRYVIRYGPHPRKSESFNDPAAAARFWNDLSDETSTLMIADNDHGLWAGTPAQVKPVYDALATLK